MGWDTFGLDGCDKNFNDPTLDNNEEFHLTKKDQQWKQIW
jgi:hypothetical protein